MQCEPWTNRCQGRIAVMEWWRWPAGALAVLLVLGLLALRFDTLKDLPGWSAGRAIRRLAPLSVLIPVVLLLALLGPWWLALTAALVPGLILLVLAAVD